jgi:hypothetical protein
MSMSAYQWLKPGCGWPQKARGDAKKTAFESLILLASKYGIGAPEFLTAKSIRRLAKRMGGF